MRTGGPISLNNLTDDKRALRDLAFPLIQPAYDRIRWDAVLYGLKREFRRDLWVADPTAYYRHLLAAEYRSTAGRYNQLNDDVRNDVVRISPFFDLAHRVMEADRKRRATMDLLPDISPADRVNALARVGENNLTIAWVQTSLAQALRKLPFRAQSSRRVGTRGARNASRSLAEAVAAADRREPARAGAAIRGGAARSRGATGIGHQVKSAFNKALAHRQRLDAALRAGQRAPRHDHEAGFRRERVQDDQSAPGR